MRWFLVFLVACSPMVYVHGVPNLDQVETNIWRGGQISSQEGWDYLAELAHGRRVHVIKLNFDHEGSDALGDAKGFDIHYLPIQPEGDQDVWDDLRSAFTGPDPAQVDEAETVLAHCLANPTTEICYGHCTHGQDRTGYVFGKHRVLHDHWTKARAYDEMLAHHFHSELHGVHEAWEQFQAP